MSIIAFSCEGYLTYSLTYLLLTPEYVCVRNGFKFDCDSEQTCSSYFNRYSHNQYKNGYFVDWTRQTSLHNWVEVFDLRCSTKWYVGLFASSFFLGQVFGTTCLSHYGDSLGRLHVLRKILLCSLVFQFIMIFISKDLWLHYILIFCQGFISNVRGSLSYLYGQEIIHSRDSVLFGSLFNIVDALTMTLMTLYFKYISKNWEYS